LHTSGCLTSRARELYQLIPLGGVAAYRRAFPLSSPPTPAAWIRAPNGAQGKRREVQATSRRGVACTSLLLRAGLLPAAYCGQVVEFRLSMVYYIRASRGPSCINWKETIR